MIRLIVVELRRTLARGTIRLLLGIVVLGLVATGVIAFFANESREAKQAEVRDQFENSVEYCLQGFDSFGRVGPGGGPAPTMAPGPRSSGGFEPTAPTREECEARYGGMLAAEPGFRLTSLWPSGIPEEADVPASYRRSGPDGGAMTPLTMLLMIGALLGGASLIGAEWQAGTFVTLLTWEPRRVRLFVTRAVVGAVLAALVAFLAFLALAAVLYPTASVKGSLSGLGAAWWSSYALASLRAGAVAGLGALLGAALAMIGRRTALAVIIGFVYFAVIEQLLGAWREGLRPWLMTSNIVLFVSGEDITTTGPESIARPMWAGAAVLAVYAVVLIAAAAAMFRRRDFISG